MEATWQLEEASLTDGLDILTMIRETLAKRKAMGCFWRDRFGAGVLGEGNSLDLAPTALRVAGLDVPESMQGVNLLDDSANRAKFVFAEEDHEGNVLRAGRSLDWKFMEANTNNPRSLPVQSLFNLAQDPGETENLVDTEPQKVALATERLNAVANWAQSEAVSSNEVELDLARKDALEIDGKYFCKICGVHYYRNMLNL